MNEQVCYLRCNSYISAAVSYATGCKLPNKVESIMMQEAALYIAPTPAKGRGMFTREVIQADTVVEIAPVIVMPQKDRVLLDQTALHDYIFEWGEQKDQCCMALGNIPIYNHSYTSNCEYFMDFEEALMFVKTVRLIDAGEELTINYNGDWNDATPLWFQAQP